MLIVLYFLQSVDEVCVVFLDDVCPKQPVKIAIGGRKMATSHVSRCVYAFSLQGIKRIKCTSLVLRNRSSGFPTRSDINRAVQSQKMPRGLKFRI